MGAKPETRGLFSAVINIELSKDECWKRRRARAESMAHLPAGLSLSDEERNYEVLETYLRSDADRDAYKKAAADRFPDEGDLAFLRLYFEEVIWPASLAQKAEVTKLQEAGHPIMTVDADTPAGKDEWMAARFPDIVKFVKA